MVRKLLNAFPKPLLEELVEGRWLPIVGAGMSKNAVLPANSSMPDWDQLARQLADGMRDYDYSGPLDAISAYAQLFSRAKLVERLFDLLLVDVARPGDAHRAFCSIQFPIVCTTNFDFLLETQYAAHPRYCRPIIYEEQLAIGGRDPSVALLKLHGDVHHPDRMVVTEDDYDGFLQRYPLIATYLANLLISKTAVLIGYSLDDPDLRQVWTVITERLGKSRKPAYAIRVGASAQEIARYERRGVKVINLPGSTRKYGEVLAAAFEELRQYQERAMIPASEVTDEDALRELQLPPDAATRLCFFAVPFSIVSLYKEVIFPLARRHGFVPITAESVVSPGDTVSAKIDALLSRANIAVVDVSSPTTQVEMRVAASKLGPDNLAIVVEAGKEAVLDLMRGVRIFKRPPPPFDDSVEFLTSVDVWLSERAGTLKDRLTLEPERLFELGQYRAAVISAITILEVELRNRLEPGLKALKRSSVLSLAEAAQERGLLTPQQTHDLQLWMKVRGVAVHTSKPVSRQEARQIVNGVRGILHALPPHGDI